MIPYSIYKNNLQYISKDKIDLYPIMDKVSFSSRNGYRHYIRLDDLIIDNKNNGYPYVYALSMIIHKYNYLIYHNILDHKKYYDPHCVYENGICINSDFDVKGEITYYSLELNRKTSKYIDIVKNTCDYSNYTDINRVTIKSIKIGKFLKELYKLLTKVYSNKITDCRIDTEINLEKAKLEIDMVMDLYNQYWSNNIKLTNDMLLVVSTHPYDILGSSTNRRWTSCMDLGKSNMWSEDNGNSEYIKDFKDYQNYVIYLIDKDDLNIRNPYYRMSTCDRYWESNSYGIANKEIENFCNNLISNLKDYNQK